MIGTCLPGAYLHELVSVIRAGCDPALAEAMQTILRRKGVTNPCELFNGLTRGKEKISKDDLHTFVDGLAVSDEVKAEMRKLTPETCTGSRAGN